MVLFYQANGQCLASGIILDDILTYTCNSLYPEFSKAIYIFQKKTLHSSLLHINHLEEEKKPATGKSVQFYKANLSLKLASWFG